MSFSLPAVSVRLGPSPCIHGWRLGRALSRGAVAGSCPAVALLGEPARAGIVSLRRCLERCTPFVRMSVSLSCFSISTQGSGGFSVSGPCSLCCVQ